MTGLETVRTRALSAALELLSAKGPDSLTLRGIARRAGIGAASIYHHFEGREALLVAVALAGYQAMKREITAARDSGDPADPMQAGSQAFFDFAAARPALFSLMFDTRLLFRHAPMRDAEQSVLSLFQELVQASERIDAKFKSTIAMALWAMGRGVAAMHASHPAGALPIGDLAQILAGADYLLDRTDQPRYRPFKA